MTQADPMIHVNVTLRASQYARIKAAGINFSEWVREQIDEKFGGEEDES